MGSLFHKVKTLWLELIFPNTCVGCGMEGVLLCPECASSLQAIPPTCFGCGMLIPPGIKTTAGRTCSSCRKRYSIYAFISPYSYREELVHSLVKAFKYRRLRLLDQELGQLITTYIASMRLTLPADALMIPVPLHKSRERSRGFNQALCLAEHLGKELPCTVVAGLLERHKKTQPQVELAPKLRETNVENVFWVRDSAYIAGKTIVLVDDVKTTGSTLESAARTLKDAGARQIWAVTFAH